MSSIIVIRGDGSRKGDDITEAILYGDAAKLERGRNEMDARAGAFMQVELTIVFRAGVRVGQLVEVLDSAQGETWRGKITGVSHSFDGVETTSKLSIQKPVRKPS